MFLTDNFYDGLIVEPKEGDASLNSLLIFSGYATAAMASYCLEDFQKREKFNGIKINLVVGMTPRDGLKESDHKRFVDLMNGYPDKFNCSYIMNNHNPVHSKLYVWCEDETPKIAFTGSANYTQTAFLSSRQGEVVVDCSPKLAFEYFNSFDSDTVYCNHAEVESFVRLYKSKMSSSESAPSSSGREGFSDMPFVSVSFITNKGNIGERSGLNWGQRPEVRRDPNQAYIPLKAEIYRTDFFPEIKKHFTVLTDDNKTLTCSRAQQNGKAIHTPLNNSHMGEYFRNRLGVPNGNPITKEHLEQYGRTDVVFYKIDEENYYMDFSQG